MRIIVAHAAWRVRRRQEQRLSAYYQSYREAMLATAIARGMVEQEAAR